MTREERKEYDKKYYQANREKISKQKKLYRQANRERILEQKKLYRQANKEKRLEYQKQYNQTPMGRASRLLRDYNKADKKYDRGKGDLTAEWILERIMSQPCSHCGKSGWEVIGCNRLDNSKPHTKDNVEPCCYECNVKLAAEENKTNFAKQVYQYTLDGKLVRIWASTAECGRNGFNQGAVAACCRGELQTYKGYKWSYTPL